MNKSKIIIIMLILAVIVEGWIIYESMKIEKRIMLGGYSFYNSGNYVSAEGTWISDTKLAAPLQSSKIICLKDSMLCTEAIAQITDGELLFVNNELSNIDTWNEKEIVTKPLDYGCARYITRFDLVQEQVTSTRTTIKTTDGCEFMSPEPIHLYLGDGFKIQNQ